MSFIYFDSGVKYARFYEVGFCNNNKLDLNSSEKMFVCVCVCVFICKFICLAVWNQWLKGICNLAISVQERATKASPGILEKIKFLSYFLPCSHGNAKGRPSEWEVWWNQNVHPESISSSKKPKVIKKK